MTAPMNGKPNMPDNASVSVVIPAHNGGRHIGQALDSVMQQSPAPLEIIVIDDGSTDQTEQVVKQYPVKHYEKVDYASTARTRQRGASLARGRWLAFLDQDDLWTPDKLSQQISCLHDNPALDGVVGMQLIFLEPGCHKPHWLRQDFINKPLPGYLPSALIVNRTKFLASGGFEPELKSTSDVAFFLSAASLGINLGTLNQVVVKRRIHDQNDSGKVQELQAGLLQAIKHSLTIRRNFQTVLTQTSPAAPPQTTPTSLKGEPNDSDIQAQTPLETTTHTTIQTSTTHQQDSEQPQNHQAPPPKVSVILAVYNGQNYLREAIDSILAQDYSNIELILVNDGSTDSTAAILKDHDKHAIIVHQANQGLGPARNAGFGVATGDYLTFLDHDDRWSPRKLSEQIQRHQTENGSTNSDPLVFSHVAQFICPSLTNEERQQVLVDTKPMPGPLAGTLLVSRRRFDEVGKFWGTNEPGEFIDWYLRATDLNLSMVMCPGLHLYRRIHRSNMGRQTSMYDRRAYLKALKSSLHRRRNIQNSNTAQQRGVADDPSPQSQPNDE